MITNHRLKKKSMWIPSTTKNKILKMFAVRPNERKFENKNDQSEKD